MAVDDAPICRPWLERNAREHVLHSGAGRTVSLQPVPAPSGRAFWLAVLFAVLSDMLDGFACLDMFGTPGRRTIGALGPSLLTLSDWAWGSLFIGSFAAGRWLERLMRGRARSAVRRIRWLRFGAVCLGGLARVLIG